MPPRWTIQDRNGNHIYLTEERWLHIIDDDNHPEMIDCEDLLIETIRLGKRKQDSLNPKKFRYSKKFDELESFNTHIVVIVLFGHKQSKNSKPVTNNYVVTAYQKEVG